MTLIVKAPLVLAKAQGGDVRYYYQGQPIEWLSDDDRERLIAEGFVEDDVDSHFTFEVPTVEPIDPVPAPNLDPRAAEVKKPRQAAAVKEWEDYAVALHEATNGEQGYTREDAEAASKQDLIATLP
ncbi:MULTISPECIES: hypothetical protein [unclassified Rhodococcus (in: high G+C Gram-positive bacteria)]|uniref:hypothetical protein n=1 Tax=unclassified Rhodococcus (in: high G+C Gram-positive bacteria) TaxID=192944 RepID=UPI0006FB2753|nr:MULTISPECIES: hypothetical protein [unclassified Rhodococcus (in: high G+C Gram-positive bacteria)]KQU30338.1 hypothetical protein ASG69_04590 [Rhodococcus sp. Leaf225]KQU44757.1 hypothetical protein ASH03_12550 [Rhodococcus sp. Leaf258]